MKELPKEFASTLSDNLSDSDIDLLMTALQEESPTSIRLHPLKKNRAFSDRKSVLWHQDGKYLASRPSFTKDPLFWAGTYYVQEASSMFLGHVFQSILPTKNVKVLDLCASPGGKSTLLNSLIGKESLLVANEVIKQRASVLSENLIRWGYPNTVVTNSDPSHFSSLDEFFDIVVVDAPCSGEGMFRKETSALREWSLDNVKLCAARQQRILEEIAPSVVPGGYLIYSTCTYNRSENEENVTRLLESDLFESVQINIEKDWGIVEVEEQVGEEALYAYRFYPNRVEGEGFFMTCLRKKGGGDPQTKKYRVRQKYFKKSQKYHALVSDWIDDLKHYEIYHNENRQLFALPSKMSDIMMYLVDHLYIKSLGVCIGEVKGKDLAPSHDLAVSLIAHPDLPRVDLDLDQALLYLRKQTLELKTEHKGWVLLTHQGHVLGWVKVLPNRLNNYYPKALRITSK